ncbi:hypothetical protein Tco_0415829 [Tanacetum coccineum]
MLLVHLKSHSSSIKTPSCGNGAHIGYNCPQKAPIISNPEQCNQTIAEPPQTLPSVHSTCNYEDENSFTYDSKLNSFNDSPVLFTHPPQIPIETYLCDCGGNNSAYMVKIVPPQIYSFVQSWNRPLFYFDDDDDEYIVIWRRPKAITPVLSTKEPVNSLIMGDEQLDTIPEKESDELIKSSVENIVPILK